jgi:hypothetical protein
MRQGKRWIPNLLVCGLLVLLPLNTEAVDQTDAPRLHTTRSHIQIDWNVDGTMGGWNLGQGQTGEPFMFWYPGWANIPSSNASSNYTRRGGNAVGFGTWVVSLGAGGVDMSWTGPRGKSHDIVPLVYDPSAGSEAHLGAATEWQQGRTGSMSPASNYWPGATVPAATDASAPPRLIHNFKPGDYIPDDNFADEILITKWTNNKDLTVTRKVSNWSHQDFDDFVIVELEIENTGVSTHDEVYLPLLATWKSNQTADQNTGGGIWWRWRDRHMDDEFRYTEAGNYVDGGAGGPAFIGAARAKGLKLSYQFDGNSPFSGYDDTGEPWSKDLETSDLKEMAFPAGKLAAHSFVGLAPVAFADDAGIHSFNANDQGKYVQPTGDQPSFQNWWSVRGVNDFDEPTPEGDTPAGVFDKLTSNTAADNPTAPGGYTNAQVYGPWALGPGDKAKVVVAYVAGSGAEYGGAGNSTIDIWQWSLTASKADYFKGEQAIVEHLEHALFAYQSEFDIPDSPPDVDVQVVSDENAKVKLFWSGAADGAVNSDYGVPDIEGYRIYRGIRGTLTASGPFNLVATIPVGGPYPAGATYTAGANWPVAVATAISDNNLKVSLEDQAAQGRSPSRSGMYGWSDPNSNAGFYYYYSVRAYASGKETWTNNSGSKTLADLPARAQKNLKNGLEGPFSYFLQINRGSPVLPYVPAADAMARDIVVVPNPWMANGTNEYGGALKIRFVNVPTKAFVYIFNSSGQLIQVMRKLDETRSEISWNGRPYSTYRANVGPGIYFYAVHSVSSASAGKIKTGTFVIIR